MTGMENQFDQETTKKIDLINRKIEEINQRRIGCRTTKIEDELDREELDEYIKSLRLTEEQKKIIETYNKNNEKYVSQKSLLYFIVIFVSVIVQVYLAFVIYELLLKQSLDIYESIYLFVLVVIFLFNLVQILKYLRIIR
ncbi:hypothetical protein CUJ83_11425 [Methanocella sp. CWC-04]|uniref:Uncharacterized protein n=1 Tax=Methanooceanicella nereidis TaxID=2052831 RepID=A0AAP2RDH8_9EURY|nr:hypothetical protein [Methanocella sp. CWC-04]MCD1295609.1 hypothetical protein [Methanocella sp. CWC-04]